MPAHEQGYADIRRDGGRGHRTTGRAVPDRLAGGLHERFQSTAAGKEPHW